MREAGVEPARPEWTLEPESSESTNSTTRASFIVAVSRLPLYITTGFLFCQGLFYKISNNFTGCKTLEPRSKKENEHLLRCSFLVREAGVEPARPEWTLEPESSESTNSTTRASFIVLLSRNSWYYSTLLPKMQALFLIFFKFLFCYHSVCVFPQAVIEYNKYLPITERSALLAKAVLPA